MQDDSTLSDYLAFAALNNPGLEAAFNRWKADLERVGQVGALPDPRFTYAYFIEEVETRVGPQRHKLGLSQTFPWFGTLGLRDEVANQAAAATRQEYEAARTRLFHAVRDSYFEYAYVMRAIVVTRENLRLLSDLESVARARYKVGAAPYASVIRAQVELGIVEDRLQSLEDLRGPVASRLNAALGRRLDAPLPGVQTIDEEPFISTEEELAALLKVRNPELKALSHEAAQAKASMDLADREAYPDFTLGVEYIQTDRADMPVHDNGKDPILASVSMTLPFFSKKYAAAEREAERRYWAALKQRADRENTLSADLKTAFYRFRDAERKIDLYRKTLLPKAEQSLQVTRQAFESGQVNFLDLVDAQRVLLEFRLSLERSLADRAQSLGELERLSGGELPAETHEGVKATEETEQ